MTADLSPGLEPLFGIELALQRVNKLGNIRDGAHARYRVARAPDVRPALVGRCVDTAAIATARLFHGDAFVEVDLIKGPIGLPTQGGGLGRNVMQAMERGIGIGLWASTGSEVDLQVADFIRYMATAADIKVIVTLSTRMIRPADIARYCASSALRHRSGRTVRSRCCRT